jgi:hypothetical protein
MTNPSQAEIMQQWVKLTEAIAALADREPAARPPGSGPTPVPTPGGGRVSVTDAELTRQRIDFGYRALGALTGRVGDREGDFVVPLVEARRLGELLLFRGLPPEADWVEVRRDRKVELRRIHRFRRWEIDSEAEYVDARDRYDRFDDGDLEQETDSATHRGRGLGAVRLRDFAPEESIGALLFLDTRFGPVVALGPRLGPATPLIFG